MIIFLMEMIHIIGIMVDCCEETCRHCVHAEYLRTREKAPEDRAVARTGRPVFAHINEKTRGTWRRDRQNILYWCYLHGSRARARTRKSPHTGE